MVCWWGWLYVGLALHLWQHKNCVWLFEHMLLLVECVRFVWFVQEECTDSSGEVGMFSFVGPCRLYILCNSQDDFHHSGYIGHNSIFRFGGIGLSSGHLRIWRISVWDGNSNISFVFGRFEFYSALLYTLYIEYVLVIRGRRKFYKKHGKWLLSSVLFNIPDICDRAL
jgi:hypothetical protein